VDDTRSTLLARLTDRDDEEAWCTFNELYRPMLVGYAHKRGLDAADADDVAQQCVEAVLANIDRYQHTGSFKAWLRTIAQNRIRDLFRKRREQQVDSGVWAAQADDEPAADELWERHWLAEHLRYCVEKVRPDIAEHTYRAFVENVIDERPAAETAERLGLTVNQVYVAKFRVLERIRNLLVDLTGSDLLGGGE
jgi:RNA polymerase sigma-70 factor (ECF subfamily)